MTISRHMKFGSAGKADSTKHSHTLKQFKTTREFRVTIMPIDNQVEPIRGNLADIHTQLHLTAQDEHVLDIKRYNHTAKERVCSNCNRSPFGHLPSIVVKEMVYTPFWFCAPFLPSNVVCSRHKAHMKPSSIANQTSMLIAR